MSQEALTSALAADDSPAALGAALAWVTATAADARADADDTVAVAAVIGLDDALATVPALTAALIGLLETAQLGAGVEAHLRERTAELTELARQVATAGAAHEELRQSEQQRRERLAEHAELRAAIDELRRLERLVRALDELEPQRAQLEARAAALTAVAGDVEPALAGTAREVIRFTEEALAALRPETRALAERLTAAEAELAVQEERRRHDEIALSAAQERTRDLRALHEERTAALRAHAKADRELAATLNTDGGAESDALERARVDLEDLDAQLATIDAALGDAVARLEDATRTERAAIPWSEAGPVS